jgi:hypothetical protein
MTNAEDIRCGDIFRFRGKKMLCLSNCTDSRHVTTFLTCTEDDGSDDHIFVCRVIRTFRLEVVGSTNLQITVLENTREEGKSCPPPDIKPSWADN